MLAAARVICASCGAANTVIVDPANGELQEYIEDCQVCCRPNVLTVRWTEGGAAVVARTT